MNIDERIRHAINVYSWITVHVEVRRLTGQAVQWPDDVPRPDGVPDELTELDVAWARDELRALLAPDSPDEPEAWLKLDAGAPANWVIDAAEHRARAVVAQLVPEQAEEEQ
jgi:hypothetical protein